MALDFLSKLKRGNAGDGNGPGAEDTGDAGMNGASRNRGYRVDPRKAAKFFKHADNAADTRQYDLSIEYYISGLKLDPDNFSHHEALREVAKRRKVGHGKPATLKERTFAKVGKHPIDRMLHHEKIWSKDTLNGSAALKVMEHAVGAIEAEPDINMQEVAYWVGELALELVQRTKKPDKNAFIKLCNLFTRIPAYDKAIEACKIAVILDPGNRDLDQLLKDLETEKTIHEGNFGSGEEGDFRDNIKDAEAQADLDAQTAVSKTVSMIERNISRFRADYEENPDDVQLLGKLVRALIERKDDTGENEAIQLLMSALKKTGQYKFKVQIGDVRMRQMRRHLRASEQKVQADPTDSQTKQAVATLKTERDQFELQEYQERAKNYPTDMRVRYELGARYFANKQYDEAIGEFQKAQADPKHRAASSAYLGQCYIANDWSDLAVDTLKQGIEAHPIHHDKLGMELRYLLMNALEKAAVEGRSLEMAQEAQKIASQILQTDISYSDIRDRLGAVKKLVSQLQQTS